MEETEIIGNYDIDARGEYPSPLPHRVLEDQDEVRVAQEYRGRRGIERERYGDMSGEEASEWLREFGVEDMLSADILQSDSYILGWNPLRPDGFEEGFDRFELYQEDGYGELVVKVGYRAPWPILQKEKVKFDWYEG